MPKLGVEHKEVKDMSAAERARARMNVAMKSPEHMLQWLHESGRRWLVFDGEELIRSLPWPDGVEALIQLTACYRDHRAAQTSTTGRMETQPSPYHPGKTIQVPVMKSETLELVELDRCIRYLITQAMALDSNWNLNQPAL